MFKKLNLTKIGVAIFVTLFIIALSVATKKAHAGEAYFGLARSTFGSEYTIPSVGYRFNNNWDITVGMFGDGITRKGDHKRSPWTSVSYVVDPEWYGFFMRMGVAYTPDINLIGDFNFRLGVGWDFGVWEAEILHLSSAGTFNTNTGVDGIGITTKIKF